MGLDRCAAYERRKKTEREAIATSLTVTNGRRFQSVNGITTGLAASLSLSRARMTTLFQVSLFRQCVVYRSRVYTVETHLNLSRWLTERPTTVHHSCVLYSPME